MKLDPVQVAVVRELLISAVREMRIAMIRTAHSSVITEGHDFSCALLDGAGELIAQSEDSPAHIFPLVHQARLALKRFAGNLGAGDLILANDPLAGGTHLNDVALIKPVFAGRRRLALAVVRGHWADIGGQVPGSISGGATEIFQEGLRIPCVKLYERGRLVEPLRDLILANVRIPDETQGDLDAMRIACGTGAARLDNIRRRVGTARLAEIMAAILAQGAKRMRRAVVALKPGHYAFEDYFDGDPTAGTGIRLVVAATVGKGRLTFDFKGSAAQVAAPLNCSLASTATGVFTAVKALLDPESPINGGAFRPLQVTAPLGTIVNARLPAACGGFGEMRRRIESVVMGALAGAAPANIAGDTKGSSNHVLIGSFNVRRDRRTVFYEWPAGGTGGFAGGDGSSAMRAYDEGDFSSILPVEMVEQEHALLIERCALRPDSGGAGTHRGGLGLRRDIRLLAEAGVLSVLSDRNVVPPFGVCGGQAGAPNRFRVRRDGAIISPSAVPGKITGFPLRRGDVVIAESAGGGGYGPPKGRDPQAIAEDLRQGYVTARDTGTKAVHLRLVASDEDIYEGGRRTVGLTKADRARLGLGAAGSLDLVELVNPRGAPLRAWVIPAKGRSGTFALGPVGRFILGLAPGTPVEIRALAFESGNF